MVPEPVLSGIPQLTLFYDRIREDHYITTTHISLYMSLFEHWHRQGFINPVTFNRQEIMACAKISGLATYHRCIKDLANFGYIQYLPSFNHLVSTRAYLLFPDDLPLVDSRRKPGERIE